MQAPFTGVAAKALRVRDGDLDIDSDEPLDKIVQLVRNAKGGGFAENLVVQQVPLRSSVPLRGQTVEFEKQA